MLTSKTILRTIQNDDGFIQFLILEEFPEKNSDQEYFGIVQFQKYKTWAFFSKRQIEELGKDIKLINQPSGRPLKDIVASLSGFHFNYDKAKSEKHYFNMSLIYLFIEDGKLSHTEWTTQHVIVNLRCYKNNPFLDIILDDKQEIFYNKKNAFSFRQSSRFRFPRFNCSFTKNLSKIQTMNELVTHLTQIPKDCSENVVLKKFIRSNMIEGGKGDSSFIIDFYLLAFLQLCSKIWDQKTLAELVSTGFIKKISNKPVFKSMDGVLLNEKIHDFLEMVQELNKLDPKWFLNIIKNWDLPFHFVADFMKYKKYFDKEKIDIQYTKYSSLYYLFHTMSKSYTKLMQPNFQLENNPEANLVSYTTSPFKKFKLVLAQDYFTLVKWGSALHNCAGNFEQMDDYKESISIGLESNKKIEYLVSIKEGKLKQFKGFKNSAPTRELFKDFVDFLKDNKIIHADTAKECRYDNVCVQRLLD